MLNLENFLLTQNSRIINFEAKEKINFLELTDQEIWSFKNFFLDCNNYQFGNLIIDDFELTNIDEKFFYLFLNKKLCLLDYGIFINNKIKFHNFFKIILNFLKIKKTKDYWVDLFEKFSLDFNQIINLNISQLTDLQKANILLIICFLFDRKQIILDLNFQNFICTNQEIIINNIEKNFNEKFNFIIFKTIEFQDNIEKQFVNSITLLPIKKIKTNKRTEIKSFLNNYKIIFSIFNKWNFVEAIIFSVLLICSFTFLYLKEQNKIFEILGYLFYSLILLNVVLFYILISTKISKYKNFTIFCFFSKKLKLLIFITFYLSLYLILLTIINIALLIIFWIIDYSFISNNFYIIFCLIVFIFLLIFLSSFVLIVSFNNLLNYNLVWGKRNGKKIYRSRNN